MYEKAEKSRENKNRAVAGSIEQKKGNGKRGFVLVDNRLDAASERKTQPDTTDATTRFNLYDSVLKSKAPSDNQMPKRTLSSPPIQRITNEEAKKAHDDEQLVWLKDKNKYIQARIMDVPKPESRDASILLMDGEAINISLAKLHLENPGAPKGHAVGIDGITYPGPSKPVAGHNVINRGIVETEMVGDEHYVRVYSGLMGAVSFDTDNPATGVGTSAYKDIHQNVNGGITISSGNNSLLWAGMGRPLRALKWSEKYFAQILSEKPELKPVYDQYTVAVSGIETQTERAKNLHSELGSKTQLYEANYKRWSGKGKKVTKNQSDNLTRLAKQITLIEKEINKVEIELKAAQLVVKNTKSRLGRDANPVIRSFLIPFATFEKISNNAMPEELNAVTAQAEEANTIITKAEATINKIALYIKGKNSASIEYGKKIKEVKRIGQLKSLTKNLIKRRALNSEQAGKAQVTVSHYEKLILEEFHNFEVALDPNKKDKTKINADDVKANVERTLNKNMEELLKLARKSMPDLDVSTFTPAGIIDAMKKRELHTRSINVDRHYEPNQFGVKAEDIDLLRKGALAGSLNTFAMFPDDMEPKRKAESGKVQHMNILRGRLGIPTQNLRDSPWLQGSDFAKSKKFEGEADTLSMHYSTWLKSKNPKFDESAFLSPKKSKIPLKNRLEMMKIFLKENGVAGDNTGNFMENVVGPWASQSMIAHVMADDYERMNKDQNIVEKTSGQNFAKMRYDLPIRRKKLKDTGKDLDLKISKNATPKELLDTLIKEFPELKQRFGKVSAKSENFTFYDHAQMVYQQFTKISHEDKDGERLIPKSLIGKMILFHDMEKWNSKEQYGKEGEHKLTIDEMHNYKELWGDNKNIEIAKALVNSDPFGEYMKGKITEREAHAEIINMAKKLGFQPEQYTQFFREYHQFFQADFSSYTDTVNYTTMDGKVVEGKPVFNRYFSMMEGKKEISRENDGETKGRFSYSKDKEGDLYSYESRFLALEELFK